DPNATTVQKDNIVERSFIKREKFRRVVTDGPFRLQCETVGTEGSQKNARKTLSKVLVHDRLWLRETIARERQERAYSIVAEHTPRLPDPFDRAFIAVMRRSGPVRIVKRTWSVERRRNADMVIAEEFEHRSRDQRKVGSDDELDCPVIASAALFG